MSKAIAKSGGSKPAAGAPVNVAAAQRKQAEPARGDAMLSETYYDNDDLQRDIGGQLDDFDARLAGAPVAPRSNRSHMPPPAPGRVEPKGPPPMRVSAPIRTSVPIRMSTSEEEEDRAQDVRDVVALPDTGDSDED